MWLVRCETRPRSQPGFEILLYLLTGTILTSSWNLSKIFPLSGIPLCLRGWFSTSAIHLHVLLIFNYVMLQIWNHHDLYFNLMSKTLPILCVSCKNPAYTVFFLERTLLWWLDWLQELKLSLIDAARFWYGMKVAASELISFAILVCIYTNGIMLVKMWAVLSK